LALGVSAGMSAAREGRKFGFSVGLAFLALGALAWWRGRGLTADVFFCVAGVLLAAALVVPAHLGPVERAWMRLALLISRVTTPILMGAVYFLVVTPTGLLMRVFGRNQLTSRRDRETLWVSRGESRRSDLRRQF
jgi:Saxitoxin biosynthesis operon protein SxtJ